MLWLMLAWAAEPQIHLVDQVLLQKTRFSGMYHYAAYAFGQDGTLLVNEGVYVYHYDRDGQLIRRLGGRGHGPGELSDVVHSSAWDGETYFIRTNNGMWNLFRNNGSFIRRLHFVADGLHFSGTHLYASNLFNDDWDGKEPPIVGIRYEHSQDFPRTFRRFHHTAVANSNALSRRFKLCFVAERGDELYVVNELEPLLYRYSPGLELEKTFPIAAPFWVEPPEKYMNNFRNWPAYMRWWFSFPKLRGLATLGQDLIVAFEVPDPDERDEPLSILMRIGAQGETKTSPFTYKGVYLGVYRDQIHVLKIFEDNNQAFPRLEVWKYTW